MGYNYHWIDEPWIVRINWTGHMTRAEFDEWMTYSFELVQNQPTAFLVDTSQVEEFDMDIIRSEVGLRVARHPNMLWLALVGLEGVILKFAVATFGRFFVLKQFKDDETAIAFLNELVAHHKQQHGAGKTGEPTQTNP
jgi:hypothetical protein